MIEPFLSSDGTNTPCDFKAYVFSGTARLIHVVIDRFPSHSRLFYDRTWNLLDLEYQYPAPLLVHDVPEPACLNEILASAERLAFPFRFMRVDYHILGDRVLIGELTSFPDNCARLIRPEQETIHIILRVVGQAEFHIK